MTAAHTAVVISALGCPPKARAHTSRWMAYMLTTNEVGLMLMQHVSMPQRAQRASSIAVDPPQDFVHAHPSMRANEPNGTQHDSRRRQSNSGPAGPTVQGGRGKRATRSRARPRDQPRTQQ